MKRYLPYLPPHFAAVEADDCEALEALNGGAELHDSHGYTLVETARFLGSLRCLELLAAAAPPREYKVVAHGDKILRRLDSSAMLTVMGLNAIETLRFGSYASLAEVCRGRPFYFEELPQGLIAHEELFTNYTIVFMNKVKGYGLMTNRDIAAGTPLGEYCGMVRSVVRSFPRLNDYCVEYPCEVGCYVIDASHWGSPLRYVNHSAVANLRAVWRHDRSLLHLYFVADRKIQRGEELTIDYGPLFWLRREL